MFTSTPNTSCSHQFKNVYTKDAHVGLDGRCLHMLFYRSHGKVIFSQVFVCPQSASWLLDHCSSLLPRDRYSSYWNAFLFQQECIPVGCVPSAAVAVSPATHYHSPPAPPCPLPRRPPATHAPLPHIPLPCMPPRHTCPPCHAHSACKQND